MRGVPVALLCVCLLGACARRPPTAPPAPAGQPPGIRTAPPPLLKTNREVIVTPGRSTNGRVASVNNAGRFVVLTFPLGTMAPPEKRLNVYRAGLKVAEVKVSGAPLDVNVVADIVAGDCQIGDEVRED